MKKGFLFIILFCLLLVGCGEKKELECIINCEDINLALGESYVMSPDTNASNPSFNYEVVGNSITINNGVISATDVGDSKLIITVKGYTGSKEINVCVHEIGLTLEGPSTVVIETEIELDLKLFGLDEDSKITWKSSDNEIARVAKGVVSGISFGKVTITAKCEDYSASIDLEVVRPEIKAITASDSLTFEENAEYNIIYDVEPFYAVDTIKIEASNDCVSIGEDNSIITKKQGSCVLKLISCANEQITKEIQINIIENEAPKFELTSDFEEVINVVYGEEYDMLKGVKAFDNADGDISLNIEYDETLKYAYGAHAITLSIQDQAGNVTTMKRTINTTWPYKVQFIGHRGSIYGVPNTEEAFLYAAGVLHYQALECDIHLTKDGVFVTNHDSYLTIKNEGGESEQVFITKTNYDDLIQYELTEGNYTGHVCTLERYLEICKTYGCDAVVELKFTTGINENSQENLPKLMKIIEDHGMLDKTIILVSFKACISWLRTNYKTLRIQYLYKDEITDEILNYCKTNKIDISVNATSGNGISEEYINKFHQEGLKVSVWTFTKYVKYKTLQNWIDLGVDYVTCDMQSMEEVTLK